MKKILYVTNITRNVNSFFIPHLNMLVDEGYKVDCACKITGEHEVKKDKLRQGIRYFDIPVTRNPLSLKNIKAFYNLYNIQKKERYDIIHVHSPIIGIYTRLLKIFYSNIKMIYTAHGYHFHKESSKLSWILFYNIEKMVSKYTDILITINNEDFEVSKKFKQKKLIKINGVGVDLNEFKAEKNIGNIRLELGLKEDDFVLIMVGEHNKNKNQIQLIKAMNLLKDNNPKIKAIFIGDGIDIERNRDYIQKNNIDNCMILGFKDNVSEFINASDVLVSLSYREGLPKNVLEGMALGKVILGTDTRGIRDLVINNGYLVECGNIKETKEVIEKLYSLNKEDFNILSEESLKLIRKYDIKNILNDIRKIYI